MRNSRPSTKLGFTLIELLIVICIIAGAGMVILAGSILEKCSSSQQNREKRGQKERPKSPECKPIIQNRGCSSGKTPLEQQCLDLLKRKKLVNKKIYTLLIPLWSKYAKENRRLLRLLRRKIHSLPSNQRKYNQIMQSNLRYDLLQSAKSSIFLKRITKAINNYKKMHIKLKHDVWDLSRRLELQEVISRNEMDKLSSYLKEVDTVLKKQVLGSVEIDSITQKAKKIIRMIK